MSPERSHCLRKSGVVRALIHEANPQVADRTGTPTHILKVCNRVGWSPTPGRAGMDLTRLQCAAAMLVFFAEAKGVCDLHRGHGQRAQLIQSDQF